MSESKRRVTRIDELAKSAPPPRDLCRPSRRPSTPSAWRRGRRVAVALVARRRHGCAVALVTLGSVHRPRTRPTTQVVAGTTTPESQAE
jgi:hypothetical protein